MGRLPMTVVIGAGLAGWRLARSLDAFWAKNGNREELLVLGDSAPLDRMALGEWASGFREAWPVLEEGWKRPESRREEVAVSGIDLVSRTLTDHTGQTRIWDRLVLALGARAVVPPAFQTGSRIVCIAEAEGASAMRTALNEGAQEVLVVGGGPLGLETAWNLAHRGLKVTVTHRGMGLLSPFLDAHGSAILARRWADEGINLRLGSVETASRGGSRPRVEFAHGTAWEGDLVVLACGTRPQTDLARRAGLSVTEAGITVDLSGLSSHPGVWAVGDCAPAPGSPPGLWAPARDSVDRLVASWGGQKAPAEAERLTFRLKTSWPVVSSGTPGAAAATVTVEDSESSWRSVRADSGKHFWEILGPLADLEARIADLEAGRVSISVSASEPQHWPASHRVCDCHGVEAGTVRQAWAGVKSLEALSKLTGAGSSCGSCRLRLLALREGRLSRSDRWSRFMRKPRWGRWSLHEVLGYLIDWSMLVTGLLTAVTGVMKMPGWMEAMGIDQRSLPDEANMALSALLDLHDWPGIILTVLALVHVGIHWGQMATFALSWFKKRGKNP